MAPKRGRRGHRETYAAKRARGEIGDFAGAPTPSPFSYGDSYMSPAPTPAPPTPAQPQLSDLEKVMDMIQDKSVECEAPGRVRDMLATSFSRALLTPAAERHEFEATILGYVQEVLEDVSERRRERAAKDETEQLGKELKACEDELETAGSELKQAVADCEAKAHQLQQQRSKHKQRASALRNVTSNVKAQAKETERIAKEKARLEEIQGEDLKAILEHEGEFDDEAIKVVKKLAKEVERLGAEPALAAAMPSALVLRPEERTEFDAVTVESLQGWVADRIKELDDRAEQLKTEGEELETEVTVKEALLEQAAYRVREMESIVEDAEAAKSEKVSAKVIAEDRLNGMRATSAGPLGAIAAARRSVVNAKEAMHIFKSLVAGADMTAEAQEGAES